MEPQHVQYYRNALGTWHGTLALWVDDLGGLWRAGLSWRDRITLLASSVGRALGGATPLTTRVIATHDPLCFQHEAELRKLGVVLYRGERTMELLGDGRSVRITGREACWPLLGWWTALPPGEAEIHDAHHATYRLPMLGTRWEIAFTTLAHEARGDLQSAFGRAEERLAR